MAGPGGPSPRVELSQPSLRTAGHWGRQAPALPVPPVSDSVAPPEAAAPHPVSLEEEDRIIVNADLTS